MSREKSDAFDLVDSDQEDSSNLPPPTSFDDAASTIASPHTNGTVTLSHVRMNRIPWRPADALPAGDVDWSRSSQVTLIDRLDTTRHPSTWEGFKIDPVVEAPTDPYTAVRPRRWKRLLRRRQPPVAPAVQETKEAYDEDDKLSSYELGRNEPKPRKTPLLPVAHTVRYNIVSEHQCRRFIITLAKASMSFGTPMHKIEDQLLEAARFLHIPAQFVLFNSELIAVFGANETVNGRTHFVQQSQGLDLGRLRESHLSYIRVTRDEISAAEGTAQLQKLIKAPPVYSKPWLLLFAFTAGFAICPMGFSGSWLDALVAGFISTMLVSFQLWIFKGVLFTGIFEMTIVILNSFIARLLNSIGGHIFCYSAISSAGVVLILPGFYVLQGSLELASKNFATGSTKLVYAIIYALSLGFCLTLGSDVAFGVDGAFRHQRDLMGKDLSAKVTINGTFSSANTTDFSALSGIFTLTQEFGATEPIRKYNYVLEGCYRDPSWGWYLRPVGSIWLFGLAPLFIFSLASINGQFWRTRNIIVEVVFGCAAFAANYVGNHYIYDRGDVVSAIGATVVGILGTILGHWYPEDALPSMIPGVLVLLPAGLTVVGGLSENITGNQTTIMTWLSSGLRMVQVTIGITVGLFASTCVVYAFTSLSKRNKNKSTAF